jgi:hypothetical protein
MQSRKKPVLFFWRRAQTRSPDSITKEMVSAEELVGSLPMELKGISAASAESKSRS